VKTWLRDKRSALKHALLVLLDRLTESLYEGPVPPKRLAERVKLFKLFNRDATPKQWEAFALAFARNCYREAFERGYRWQANAWKTRPVDMPAEQFREMLGQDWALAELNRDWRLVLERGHDPRDPIASLSDEQRRGIVGVLGGQFPVEVDLAPYEGPPVMNGNPGFHWKEQNDE
jgi:hypothetical protein